MDLHGVYIIQSCCEYATMGRAMDQYQRRRHPINRVMNLFPGYSDRHHPDRQRSLTAPIHQVRGVKSLLNHTSLLPAIGVAVTH
jgi:hypothetical protein